MPEASYALTRLFQNRLQRFGSARETFKNDTCDVFQSMSPFSACPIPFQGWGFVLAASSFKEIGLKTLILPNNVRPEDVFSATCGKPFHNRLCIFQTSMSASPESEIAEQTEDPDPKPLPRGFLNALDDTVNEEIPWIIEKLLAEGEQMLVFGAPKVGKSQFALQLACCLAMGEPFLGWPISMQRRVLYLNFEMGKHIFMLRIARHFSRLMEERKKRECEESGQEYLCEDELWHKLEDGVPLGVELRGEINEIIEDQLFFCSDLKSLHGDHVPKSAISPQKNKESNPKSEGESNQDSLVRYWQSVIKEVNPDLVIFDTLSKTHAINESDNSEIQQVLMRIRDICRIPAVTTTGSDGGDATGGNRDEGKHIAHIIVHHARKSSPDSKNKGQIWMDLDSIRGGSAIRAEADVICGIFFAKRKTATHQETNRHLVVEARNFAPFDQPLNFEVFAFCHPRQRTPEEVEIERNESNKLDEFILGLIRGAFVQSGMRGLKISTLEAKVRAGLKTFKQGDAFSERGLKKKLQMLAMQDTSEFETRKKKGLEKQTAEFPHERDTGPKLYWVKDGSPWLKEDSLKAAINKHVPYTVRKVRVPKAEGAG